MSESLVMGEMISADVINRCMKDLPDVGVDRLNEFEYSLFTLFNINSGFRGKCQIISILISLIYAVQRFATICVHFLITDILDKNTILTQILNFFLMFCVPTSLEQTSIIYFYIMQILTSISVGLFFFGLIMIHKRYNLSKFSNYMIFIFAFNIGFVLYLPNTILVTRQISLILQNRAQTFIVPSIFHFVIWAAHTFVFSLIVIYRHTFFCPRGSGILHFNSYAIDSMYVIMAASCYGAISFMDVKDSLIGSGVVCLLSACVILTCIKLSYFAEEFRTVIHFTEALTLIISGILSIFKAFIPSIESMMAIMGILIFFIIDYTLNKHFIGKANAKRADDLAMVSGSFNQLNIHNETQFMMYYSAGFASAIPCCFDGSFLHWGLNNMRLHFYKFGLLNYACMMPENTIGLATLSKLVDSEAHSSISGKLSYYQFRRIYDLRHSRFSLIAEKKFEITNQIIDKFQNIFECFGRVVPMEASDIFVYADAIVQLRRLIRYAVDYWGQLYPNCSISLRLRSHYLSQVEFSEKCKEKSALANLFDEGESYIKHYEDISYLGSWKRVVDRLYPLTGGRKNRATREFSEFSYLAGKDFDVKDSGASFNKYSPHWIYTIALFIFMALMHIVLMIVSFVIITRVQNEIVQQGDLAKGFIDLSFAFSYMFSAPLDPGIDADERLYPNDSLIIEETNNKYQRVYDALYKLRNESNWFNTEELLDVTMFKNTSIYTRYNMYPYQYFSIALNILPAPGNFIPELLVKMASLLLYTTDYLDNVLVRAGDNIQQTIMSYFRNLIIIQHSLCFISVLCSLLLFIPLYIYHHKVRQIIEDAKREKSTKSSALLSIYLKRQFTTHNTAFGEAALLIFILVVLIIFYSVLSYYDIMGDAPQIGKQLKLAIDDAAISAHLAGSGASLTIKLAGITDISTYRLLKPINAILKDLGGKFTVLSEYDAKSVGLFIDLTNYIMLQICGDDLCEKADYLKAFDDSFQLFQPQLAAATDQYIDKIILAGVTEKSTLVEINFLVFLLISIVTVTLFIVIVTIDKITMTAAQLASAQQTANAVSIPDVRRSILDLIDRPAAITVGGSIYYANKLFTGMYGQIDRIVGMDIRKFVGGDYCSIKFDGMVFHYAAQTREMKRLSVKAIELKQTVEKLVERVNPVTSKPYIAHAEISFFPCGPITKSEDFCNDLKVFEEAIAMIMLTTPDSQQVNWSIRGHSIIIGADSKKLALMHCLIGSLKLIRFVADRQWMSSECAVSIDVSSAKVKGSVKESVEWNEARVSEDRNSIVIDTISVKELGKLANILDLTNLPDGFGCFIGLPEQSPMLSFFASADR